MLISQKSIQNFESLTRAFFDFSEIIETTKCNSCSRSARLTLCSIYSWSQREMNFRMTRSYYFRSSFAFLSLFFKLGLSVFRNTYSDQLTLTKLKIIRRIFSANAFHLSFFFWAISRYQDLRTSTATPHSGRSFLPDKMSLTVKSLKICRDFKKSNSFQSWWIELLSISPEK